MNEPEGLRGWKKSVWFGHVVFEGSVLADS